MSPAGTFFRALFGRIGIALVLCVAVVAAGVFWVNRYIDDEIERIPRVALATATSSTANGTNFLIVGSDSREFVSGDDVEHFGTTGDTGPPKSDTMMVLHANGDHSYVVSFPRDLWVTIPGRGDMKLNAAFNDGPQAVVDTLQQNFGIAIDHYLEVDFRSFAGLVDAVGRIPVYFEYTTMDEFTGLLIPFPDTCYQLDGGQSLAYVRSRSPEYFIDGRWQDGGGIPDLDRIGRQQEFLRTLGRITIERATDDPRIAPDLADSVIPNLQADEGFDRAAFNALGRAFMGLGTGDESGIQFATLPTEGARRGGQDVLLSEQPGADEMLAVLRGDVVPDAVADDASATDDAAPVGVRPSEIRVSVRNGSGVAGAAGTALNDLSNRGFVSGVAANDERGTVARSEVRHRAGEEAKANLVASYVRGGVDLVVDNALGGDVVLVVGKSFTGIADAPSSPAKGAPAAPDTTLSPKDACR